MSKDRGPFKETLFLVLQTVEPECAAEDESLTRLRGDIWAVLTAVAKRGGA